MDKMAKRLRLTDGEVAKTVRDNSDCEDFAYDSADKIAKKIIALQNKGDKDDR